MDQWQALIDGCKRNDRSAQERLYRQLYPALFHLCKKFFQDDHDILTALNSGMLKVFQNIGSYDPAKGAFFSWAYTIVRNAALSLLKSKKTEPAFEHLDETHAAFSNPHPFQHAGWEERFDYLSVLPPITRAVCSLFYLEEFSIKDIAGALEIKEGTVKWHLNESRTRLRKRFNQNDS